LLLVDERGSQELARASKQQLAAQLVAIVAQRLRT
jgi:hypothetical protein